MLLFVVIKGGALVRDLLFWRGARGASFPRVELVDPVLVVFAKFTGSGKHFFAAKFELFDMLLFTVRLLFAFGVEKGFEFRDVAPPALFAEENPEGAVKLKVSFVVAPEPPLNSFFLSFSIKA